MLSINHCQNSPVRTHFAKLYRDWRNDYLTVERFAEDYGFSVNHANRAIRIGRKAHNLGY